ncbi:hypothetical protein AKJ09_01011 [Labilithrix luteola]|uniref:Uncharacterized protein n=1 Tax=Labilithrix luteola TaxID=1391654 RepID=A0A0K1PLE6_9BACT|nr:hypothetical protein AKJ09_01011 [Labilithrix luteola]
MSAFVSAFGAGIVSLVFPASLVVAGAFDAADPASTTSVEVGALGGVDEPLPLPQAARA